MSLLSDFGFQVEQAHQHLSAVILHTVKKTNRDDGPALVGIELNSAHDYDMLIRRLKEYRFDFSVLAEDDNLFAYPV
jgi:hypothetical protein